MNDSKKSIILGIESSCDETAAAVYETGVGVRSSDLFSQISLHQEFGGVVPEIASRSHLEKMPVIISKALEDAQCTLDDIDVVAVANKPGLPGSLLIGLCFAKAIAWTKNKKLIGVNHLEAHIFSSFLDHDVPFPHICLAASGGHTSLYFVEDFGKYHCIGQTLDDAAGEAFDKVAKLIHLSYPGGPVIERMAAEVEFEDFFKYPRSHIKTLDFSFSGLKTAVLYDLVKRNVYDMKTKEFLRPDDVELQRKVASSLLVCIGNVFADRIKKALSAYPTSKAVTFVGGVACNKYLRKELEEVCQAHTIPLFFPAPRYCTDNAAMIAFVGAYKAERNEFDALTLDIL